jgi:hypothetical protein
MLLAAGGLGTHDFGACRLLHYKLMLLLLLLLNECLGGRMKERGSKRKN